ncbi:unnamed protein product [Caenorhabditis auriculariae]|uniref:EGF-like domain-containing protein n=1 Tax=Caenorhabditis auriculariae TaxID=2777116 RepID=A0A8S1HZC4_9PELO|nr:unnamed protein product [Caenorhabditis auriculariae]
MTFHFRTLKHFKMVATSQKCQNDGISWNGTCTCPAFIDGDHCENIKCQRFSIKDKNRCVCAPGWYGRYCGIRGCRPMVKKNVDISQRSFIIVFNTKKSMQPVLDTLKANLAAVFDNIVKTASGSKDDWIANFIFYGFNTKNNKTTLTKFIANSRAEFLTNLNTVQLIDTNEPQPIMTAVRDAQQLYTRMRAFSIVLVFSDAVASDATPESSSVTVPSPEQQAFQISLLWRSKVSYVLTLPSGGDTSGDKFDVFRRVTRSSHGDLFLVNPNAVSEVLLKVISKFYVPEDIAAGYGATGDLQLQLNKDSAADLAFVLLTIDTTNANNNLPSVQGLTPISTGPSYSFYSLTGSSLSLKSSGGGGSYNYRVFLQSRETLFFDFNSDVLIDVGNGIVHNGVNMTATALFVGFGGVTNTSYSIYTPSMAPVRGELFAQLRPQLDCTYPYLFDKWVTSDPTLACPPGPITQVHTVYLGNQKKIRVLPGYCATIAHDQPMGGENEQRPLSVKHKSPARNDATYFCDSTNVNAIGDPRQTEFKQIVFILECRSSNKPTFDRLAASIRNITSAALDTLPVYNRYFSLITFDDQGVDVLLSTHEVDRFNEDFGSAVQSITYSANVVSSRAIEAVYKAQKIALFPPTAVFLFTSEDSQNVQNYSGRHWDTVDKDTQVNLVSIGKDSSPDIFAVNPQLRLLQRQSNGRLLHLVNGASLDLSSLLSPSIYATALSLDFTKQDCVASAAGTDFVVEKNADKVVIEVYGKQVKAPDSIAIYDDTQKKVQISDSITFSDDDVVIITLVKPQNGHWGMSVKTSSGGCAVQVRHVSSYAVVLGFVSNPNDDFATTQIFSQRETGTFTVSNYLTIRVSQNESVVAIPPSRIDIATIDVTSFPQPNDLRNLTLVTRDLSTCAYQYVSSPVELPKVALTKITVVALSDDTVPITLLQRIFYFYQHFPVDKSVCNGGAVKDSGECDCPTRYTGEYCYDRICAQGATLSLGICSCRPGFLGDFCEIELLNSSNSTTSIPTTAVPTTRSQLPTTTRASSQLTPIFIYFIYFFITFRIFSN